MNLQKISQLTDGIDNTIFFRCDTFQPTDPFTTVAKSTNAADSMRTLECSRKNSSRECSIRYAWGSLPLDLNWDPSARSIAAVP